MRAVIYHGPAGYVRVPFADMSACRVPGGALDEKG
jgi:hypothetical protein